MKCDKCDSSAMHTKEFRNNRERIVELLCCFHHVEAGNAPADWHIGCLEAYAKKHGWAYR